MACLAAWNYQNFNCNLKFGTFSQKLANCFDYPLLTLFDIFWRKQKPAKSDSRGGKVKFKISRIFSRSCNWKVIIELQKTLKSVGSSALTSFKCDSIKGVKLQNCFSRNCPVSKAQMTKVFSAKFSSKMNSQILPNQWIFWLKNFPKLQSPLTFCPKYFPKDFTCKCTYIFCANSDSVL